MKWGGVADRALKGGGQEHHTWRSIFKKTGGWLLLYVMIKEDIVLLKR